MTPANDSDAAYALTTRAITIMVEPFYLEDQSEPDDNRYIWAYHVRIENNGAETVQLLTRHWRIIDSLGNTQEVRGDGVVGEQPVLKPGESFEYTSGTPLATSSGIMAGSYQMETDGGDRFDAEVPAFSLDSPDAPMRVH
jgi:ApaG protein